MAKKNLDWASLRALLGLRVDDPRVNELLASVGKVKWGTPNMGHQYAVAKKAGFDLLAVPSDGKIRGKNYVVSTIFLYSKGREGHDEFAPLPYGLSFGTRKQLRAAMPKPASKDDDRDEWEIDGARVRAYYGDEERVTTIQVALADE